MSIVVCHAGSASNPAHKDGPRRACGAALDAAARGGSALRAAVVATAVLEDDERFNAGTGSNLRLDGKTIQMDAACMSSDRSFTAVAALERTKNPVLVAERLRETPHILLAGAGATAYARRCGFEDHDPTTAGAQRRLADIVAAAGDLGEWRLDDLVDNWNFDTPLREALGSDTVGSVVFDGDGFAAALSSGGTTTVLLGRVGDVPLPGCGLYAGPHGAVATTGDGEHIVRSLLAYRAYAELERGRSAADVVAWALAELADDVDVGIIVTTRNQFAGGSRHDMAWHGQQTGGPG